MADTLTFMFSDIAESSRLWDEHPEPMRRALAVHNEAVRGAVADHGGRIVKDRGDGFLTIFGGAPDAIAAALEVQRRLAAASWEEPPGPLHVRLGLHSGTAESRDGDFFGPDVNRAARLEAAAHGGQVLVSEATRALAQDGLPAGIELRDLGLHTLRGLTRPERLYQLVAPDLPHEFPPVRTVAGGRAPFPAFMNSFVGRSDEILGLSDRLADPDTRILTLLGPGGIGKTRLAVETVTHAASRFSGGAAFADLAPVAEPDGIPMAIALAMGVHPEGSASVMDMVVSEIASPTLIVLDNFEHVIAGSPFVTDLVARCREATVLVTSRTPLHIRGEVVHQMEPLAVEPGNGGIPAAIDLFVDRAAGYGVALDVEGSDGAAVRSIVRRLAGLPLAIELAAARVRLLSVGELDRRLAQSLSVVGSGAADLPERQQTIQATIDWSVGALTPEQRALFHRLSVFPAGATLEQIEQVAAAGLGRNALDLVSALVDHSLVTVNSSLPGGTRYGQLTLLREYAAEELDKGEGEDLTFSGLVDHYAATAPALARAIENDAARMDATEIDYPNLAAAMQWSLDAGRGADMVRVVFELWGLWFNGDRVREAAAWAGRADREVVSPELDWLIGFFAFQTGDYVTVADRIDKALDGFRASSNRIGVALAQMIAGALAQPAPAEEMLKEALAVFKAEDRPLSRLYTTFLISAKAAEVGDTNRALDLRSQLVDDPDAAGYDTVRAWRHWNLGCTLLVLGRIDEALEHNAQAFKTFVERSYHEGIASVGELVAIVEAERGEAERAILIHGACEAVWERLGVRVTWEIVPLIADAMWKVRQQLGDTEYERLVARGRTLPIRGLVELIEQRPGP